MHGEWGSVTHTQSLSLRHALSLAFLVSLVSLASLVTRGARASLLAVQVAQPIANRATTKQLLAFMP